LLGGDFADGVDELVEVGDGCVDVRGDADATDIFPGDADGVDFVLVEERVLKVARSHAVDRDAADGAGVAHVERGVELDLGDRLNPRGPVIFEVADTIFFALGADAVVEVDGFADALLDREAARAEGFKFADVRAARFGVAGEWPDFFNFVSLDPQHSAADRRGEKFMQARPEVIAVKVRDFEVHEAEGVGAVADDLNIVRVGHV